MSAVSIDHHRFLNNAFLVCPVLPNARMPTERWNVSLKELLKNLLTCRFLMWEIVILVKARTNPNSMTSQLSNFLPISCNWASCTVVLEITNQKMFQCVQRTWMFCLSSERIMMIKSSLSKLTAKAPAFYKDFYDFCLTLCLT